MIKVLAFDIDGVLAESRQVISDEIRDMLVELAKKYTIVLSTGGNMGLIFEQVINPCSKYLGGEGVTFHCFSTSGTSYSTVSFDKLYSPREHLVYEETLSNWDKVCIYYLIKDMADAFHLTPITNHSDMVDDRKTQINFSLLGRSSPLREKQAFDPERKKREEIVECFKSHIPNSLQMTIGGTTSIDFVKKGFTKGSSLKTFLSDSGVKSDEAIFYGDNIVPGGNDYSVKGVCITVQVTNPEETLERLKELI